MSLTPASMLWTVIQIMEWTGASHREVLQGMNVGLLPFTRLSNGLCASKTQDVDRWATERLNLDGRA